jgi:hypothetical protein
MVMLLTQFTKDLPFTRRMPTQIWSYILAFAVLMASNAFTAGINIDTVGQAVFNAVVISLAANGGYTVLSQPNVPVKEAKGDGAAPP